MTFQKILKPAFVALIMTVIVLSLKGTVRAQVSNQPSLGFAPSALTVKSGDIFTTPVMLNTAGQAVEGAGARIKYDPVVVKVLTVEPGTLFADYPVAAFDNTKGLVSVSGIVSSPNESYTGNDVLAKVTWQLLQPQATTISFDFTMGSTTDSNIAVKTGNGDILGAVTNLVITPGTSTAVAQNTTSQSDSVTAVEPVSGPVATTFTKVKIFSNNLLTTLRDKFTFLFGGSQVDPYTPIKSQAPQTTLLAAQPDSSITVDDANGTKTLQATPVTPSLIPFLLIGFGLLGIMVIVVWMVMRRNKQEVVVDTVYQPPMPQNNEPPQAIP